MVYVSLYMNSSTVMLLVHDRRMNSRYVQWLLALAKHITFIQSIGFEAYQSDGESLTGLEFEPRVLMDCEFS